MILLVHNKGQYVVQVVKNGRTVTASKNLCQAVWQLARKFPEEIILWVEQDLQEFFRPQVAKKLISHERIMLSFSVRTKFLPETIGYVDQLPFININPEVRYPTWRMSSDVGAIQGKTLLSFEPEFVSLRNFDHLINSIAKVGQQNGLFCYSDPGLLQLDEKQKEPAARAGANELFSFVYTHYKTVWVFILFFCLARYEKQYPAWALLRSFFTQKKFGKKIGLPEISRVGEEADTSIDVIIPTFGRSQFVQQVVNDLGRQTLLPQRVIIVEQNPEPDSVTELTEILQQKWPFEVVHIFTHETGACRSRNKALKEVRSEWIFFADDDIRIKTEVLKDTINEAARLKTDCVNLNCKQEGENTVFKKVKQWGSFGSGTSVVKSKYGLQHEFSEAFEYGYGEDADYGMKLRNSGCDIIYHPNLELLHLKAQVGGFRKKPILEWEKEDPQPKPSPTIMMLARRYYTPIQLKGYKVSLFLKFYRGNETANPSRFISDMESKWSKSEVWAAKMEREGYEI